MRLLRKARRPGPLRSRRATHLDELFGTAVRLTGSRSDAEDLVQEAVMRAWAFWDRFEAGTNAAPGCTGS